MGTGRSRESGVAASAPSRAESVIPVTERISSGQCSAGWKTAVYALAYQRGEVISKRALDNPL